MLFSIRLPCEALKTKAPLGPMRFANASMTKVLFFARNTADGQCPIQLCCSPTDCRSRPLRRHWHLWDQCGLRMYASRRRRRCFLQATNLLQPGGAARQGRSPERGRQLLLFHAHVRSFTMLSGAADIGCKIPRGSIHATDSRRFGRGLHLPGAKLVSCLKQQEKGCRRTPDAECGRV